MPGEDNDLIYGIHAVEEMLLAMPERVRQVLLDAGCGGGARRVAEEARRHGVEVRVLPAMAFRNLSRGRPFQGVAARVAAYEYAELDDVAALAARTDPRALLVAMDSIQDPGNLGSVLRTSAFFGVKGIILPRDRSVGVTPTVARISAGALARVPMVQVTNLVRSLGELKDQGWLVLGASAHDGDDPVLLKRSGPAVLVLGSEEKGLRRLVGKTCDGLVTIPSLGGFESLNVGVSAGILIHLLMFSDVGPGRDG